MICNIVSVVDDDLMVRGSMVDLLNSMGFTALAFDSAEQFIDSDEIKNTFCLITDQNLPGLSGVELQSYMRDKGYGTAVIVITGFPKQTLRERALREGALAYLTKPFEETVLVNLLQTATSPSEHRPRA